MVTRGDVSFFCTITIRTSLSFFELRFKRIDKLERIERVQKKLRKKIQPAIGHSCVLLAEVRTATNK